jgi:HEAT repeat protein
LIVGFRDPDAAVRATTAQELCVNMESLGPADDAATPALIEALGDSNTTVALCAADALAHIGPSAVLQLVAALRSGDAAVQQRAQYALRRMAPTLVPAIPALLRAAKTDTRPDDIIAMLEARDVRDSVATWQNVCALLGRIGPDAAPALIAALDDPTGSVRLCAATALLDMGAPPRAVPALRRRMEDPEPQIRRVARAAVERRQPPR